MAKSENGSYWLYLFQKDGRLKFIAWHAVFAIDQIFKLPTSVLYPAHRKGKHYPVQPMAGFIEAQTNRKAP